MDTSVTLRIILVTVLSATLLAAALGLGTVSALTWQTDTVDPTGSAGAASSAALPVVPLPGSMGAPQDPNGDGLYEDVTGNGALAFGDVILYFNQMDWIMANEPLAAFDYTKNGGIGFADIIWLFNQIGATPERAFTVRAIAIGPGEIIPSGDVTVPEGGNVTFSLESRSELPTPYSTQSGYYVYNEIFVDPTVVPTPHPTIVPYGPGNFTPSYTLSNVRSDHTVYAVFYYTMVIC